MLKKKKRKYKMRIGFGFVSTRYKDIFDFYYLINKEDLNLKYDKKAV